MPPTCSSSYPGTPTASQSLNRYAYCQGNPVNQNDPFGLCPKKQENQTAHMLLAIAGMIPVLGIVANAYNAYLYFEEGDILNGILSVAGAVVGVGGLMSTIGMAAKACTLIQAGQYVKAAGLAYTTAAMAYMTVDNAYQTYNLLVENDFTFTEEVQLSIGNTFLAGIGTVAGFKGFINCMNETAAMIQKAEASCFVAGTQVLTREGFKNIEDIQPGDYVYSTSDETGESDYKEVLEVFVKETEVITHVFYSTKDNDGQESEIHEIETTLNHRFWSEGKWKSAGTLKAGDLLTLADGTQVEVTDVTFEDRHETVYNMEVADYHTYYVGEDGVWVHNRYGQKGGRGNVGSRRRGSIPVKDKVTAGNGLSYQSNPKHTVGQPGNGPSAGIEPNNSLDLFAESIPSSIKPNQRYAFDYETNTLHRFFEGDGVWHWSGSTNQGANSLVGN